MTTKNFDYVTGDTLEIEVTCRWADGSAVDLDGATARWEVAPVTPRLLGAAIVAATIGDGIEVTDEAGGVLLITMLRGVITTTGDYFHHLKLTMPGGEALTPLQGTIKAKRALITT